MCGIFGIYGHNDAANMAYLGIHALQHRGQESAGISAGDGSAIRTYRGMGLVVDVFDASTIARLQGRAAIGHVRYSTAGDSDIANAQPMTVRYHSGHLSVAHNGNLVNAGSLRDRLEREGSIFTSNSDSEVIVHLFARGRGATDYDRLLEVLPQLRGAYSTLFLTQGKLIAARDPYGIRPLSMGVIEKKNDNGRSERCWVFASETCAFSLIGAQFVRHVDPGEIVVVDEQGLQSHRVEQQPQPRFCIFEHIYFARPDAVLGDATVYLSRRKLGNQLAREQPAAADVVIPVPDSGTAAAMGYAEELGLPFELGLVRSHYVGRTFIEPQQSIRNFGVKLKLAPVRELIANKRVVVVDDSLVRGTTSRKIVQMIRNAGAREVHMRISAPPTRYPCFYGIDTPTREELIAAQKGIDEIRAFTECDSLGYLSMEGMLKALARDDDGAYCSACFSGDYPVPIEEQYTAKPLPLLNRTPRSSVYR